jgi:hypothetical protein
MNDPQLHVCPRCGQSWPRTADYQLRGFGWLTGLPRGITPSDIDGIFHDGAHGRDRFLVLEAKRSGEWPLQAGQLWLLRALSGLSGVKVCLLVGDMDAIERYWVTVDGLGEPEMVTPEQVRRGVASWLG